MLALQIEGWLVSKCSRINVNFAFLIFGGADGIRTHDLLDAIEARSQLRHGPTGGAKKFYHKMEEERPVARSRKQTFTCKKVAGSG